jgi:uncharacterized membrane protein YfcA
MTVLDGKLAAAGLLIGALVGLTGMGGGSLMTPLLVLLGIPPVKAVGTDLAYAAVTKTIGAWRHHALANVNYPIARWLAAGSVPASIVGVFTLTQLKHSLGPDLDTWIQRALGVALILVGSALVARTFLRPHVVVEEQGDALSRRQKVMAVGVGVLFGFALGLTSVGSGVFFGMALMLLFPLRASRIVGTDVFHAALLVAAAAGAHTIAGNVDFGSVGWILVGSLPGILIGAQFTGRLPDRPLRMALGATLAAAGAAMFA